MPERAVALSAGCDPPDVACPRSLLVVAGAAMSGMVLGQCRRNHLAGGIQRLLYDKLKT
jgi:hypothetical protein